MKDRFISIIGFLILSLILYGSVAFNKNKSEKPNLLLILVDDVGYMDIGAFANHLTNASPDELFYETPRIDQLAREGTMFTQFYASSVCAPSRASLMTGKMSNRMGMWDAYAYVNTTFEKTEKPVPDGCHILDHEPWAEYNYSKTDRGVSVPLAGTALHDVKTIPQGLTGYHSAFIGKWHLGSHNHVGYRPEDQGFDEILAYFDGGGSGYYRPFTAYAARTDKWDKPGPELSPQQDYLSDDIAQRTNVFLEDRAKNHPDEPFFLYLSHPAAHSPIQSRADDMAYFENKVENPDLIGHRNPEYAGLIKGMDRSIGAVLDKLDQLKLADNTVVIFISDNGGHPVFTRNTPLRGGKSMLYEGGIRVPMIVRWPGKTKPGTKCDITSDIADIYPTLMEISGIDYSDFKADKTTDGESLKPLFSDLENTKNSYTRDEFYQFYGKMGYKGFHNFATWAMLRKGDYKLHYDYHGKVELYNIAEDMFETNDLVQSKPRLAYDMLVQLTDWLKANSNEAYLPVSNPNFDPTGDLPYGAYVPLEELKSLLLTSNTNKEASTQTYEYLKTNFKNPGSSSGVNCWWWWLNGNVNEAAITKDLEAMKSKNFQGAMIFDAGGHNQRGNRDIPAGPLFGSDEWNELFVFALDEAKRLGLEIGFNIQSGWNLGGPRVTPQYTAKQITCSEQKISGNKNVSLKLELPQMRRDFYKDIAVLAFPINDDQKTNSVITDLDLKLGFHELGGSAPDTRFLLTNSSKDSRNSENNSSYIVSKQDILDISSQMDANGNLTWEVPEGDWNILRVGYTCTDSHVSTSSGDWQGSVLDYMSEEAFNFYWNDVVEPIFNAAGDHVGATLKYMETDSWECGGMNWTDKFAEEFIQYRGYDLINYLPIVAGYVVDNIETSNAFLADFRKTLGDLVAYNHYAVFQEYAHQHNMGIQPESAGPHAGPLDGIKNYGFSDIVMSEFWSPSPHRPKPENRFFLKQASSAAHIYGKKIVGAESFTTIGQHWNDELWHDQKSSFDHEICAGLNRMYFHTFTSSPPEMGLPGQEYFAGTHVNPQVTWWEQSGAFIDYMHRTQSVVQEGKFVADVLYYYGDHVPNVFPFKHADPAGAMSGFDYDVTDETIFLQLKVDDGKIIVPGGVKYRVLVLPNHKVLSMAALEKAEELLQQGATIIGYKPEELLSLVGGTEAQKTFNELINKIWGVITSEKGEKNYGRGIVAWGMTAREYLMSKDVPADFDILENDSKTDFDYIHYTLGERDVYFVTNQTTRRQKTDARFRISGKQPEFWDALTGEIREAKAFTQNNGLTTVPLTLEPYGAIMVAFNNDISENKQGTVTRNYSDFETLKEVKGEWSVEFDPRWGGPGTVIFPGLSDWSQHSYEGIKYYSGTGVYNKTFNIDFEPQQDKQYFLQLGSVKDVGIAEVKINGKEKGVVWTSPFRVEISDELQKGENILEIKVVNSWYNRVVGDQISSDKKQYTSTNIDLKHDYRGRPIAEIPLEPSGLLGPVTILLGNPMSLIDLENDHPRILVNDGDKQIVLSKIENQEWAKKLYGDLLEKIEPIADRHTKQPDWILSRYQMYRIPGKYYTDFYTDSDGTALIEMEGNAPVPTIRGNTHKRPALDPDGFRFRSPRLEEFPVNDTMYEMFLQSTAPSGEWHWTDPQIVVGHINGTVNTICLESAIIYWLTGDEKYAKLASDIIVQWVNGAYYQNPYQGACRDGFFAVQSLDDLAYSTLPIAFDFLYGYLKRNEAPLDKFDAVFERLTQTQLERGFWNNNWFAAQSPTYVYSALAISDKEKRDKYLHYFMYEDHINGICGRLSLKTTCERWLTPDGHWKEPGGYHNFPVGNILQASVAAEKNGYKVLTEFPPLYKASYVMMRYLFPNKKVMAFGDTGRGTMDPKHLEIAIAMAIKYNDPVLPTLVTAIKQMIDDGYKREDAGWFGLLNNIGALPATESSEIELPRTGTLDFAKCFYQRNGVDQINGMMCYVQGATYNHNHCNGIAMELYGQGLVLGNDPGIGGHYDTQIHKEYYALFAAHNTVIAAGKSGPLEPFRGSGGSKPMGASKLNVMEPLPDHAAVSPYCSFTSVDYLEPSTHTNQKRTLALIRTSERTGYYVDIFHSDNTEKNEYLYHNLGNSLKLFDTENNLIPMFATTELSEHVDGYGPGCKHFDKKLTTTIYENDVKAHFRLDVEDREDVFMDMHIAGGAGREYFTAMAPKSYTAPSEYKLLPNPVAVVRQNGDAWKNPFMVVYESYTGEKNSSITDVSGDSNGETSVLKVESEFGMQTIIQSFSNKAYQNEGDFFAGHFGVISSRDNALSYLYIGDGIKISSGEYSIEAKDNMRMNANMELRNDRIIISSNQPAIIYLPFGNKENIVFELNGEKKELNVQKTSDKLWKIEIPPVMNAVIYK